MENTTLNNDEQLVLSCNDELYGCIVLDVVKHPRQANAKPAAMLDPKM